MAVVPCIGGLQISIHSENGLCPPRLLPISRCMLSSTADAQNGRGLPPAVLQQAGAKSSAPGESQGAVEPCLCLSDHVLTSDRLKT